MTYPYPPLVGEDPEVVASRLADALQAAWDDVDGEYRRVVESVDTGRKRAALRSLREFRDAIERYQARLGIEAQEFVTVHLADRYRAGALVADDSFAWTAAHRQALVSLGADTYADFLRRSQEAGRTSARVARLVRGFARAEVVKGVAGGRTPAQAGRRLAQMLEKRGLPQITYRDGSVHSVREWAHVATITKSAVASNVGLLNTSIASGVSWVEVFDGAECGLSSHHDPRKAAGLVLHVTEAQQYPLSHPRCRRALGPRPDVRTRADAKRAEPTRDPLAERPEITQQPAALSGREARRQQIAARRARRTEPVPSA